MIAPRADESGDAPIGWLEAWIEQVSAGGRVLDLGAGEGQVAHWLARQGFSVEAVERDPGKVEELLRLAEQEPNLRAVESDLLDLRLAPGNYDLILASAILHLLRPSDLWALADRLQRALAPGGLVMAEVLTVDDPAFEWYRRQGHRQVEPNTYRLAGARGWIHFFEPGELANVFAALTVIHQESSRRSAPDAEFDFRSGELLIARQSARSDLESPVP